MSHHRYISQRLVNAVAEHTVRVADDGYTDVAVTEVLGGYPLQVQEGIFSGGDPPTTRPEVESTRWSDKVIDAEFELRIDGLTIGLPNFHHWHWTFGAAKAWIDNKLILDEPDRGHLATHEVRLSQVFATVPSRLPGKHTQRMELQVVAPNGMTATAKFDRTFTIYDDRKLAPTTRQGTKEGP